MPPPATSSSSSAQPTPQDVYVGEDFYVPTFRLRIGGTDLKKNVIQDVISVTYTDSLKEIDSFELTVNNFDPGQAAANQKPDQAAPFKYSDGPIFDPYQSALLEMGYIRSGTEALEVMLTGEITTMHPVFPASGGSTLSVRALNVLHRFRVRQDLKPFIDKKDSDIAEAIIGKITQEVRKTQPKLNVQFDKAELENNKKHEDKIPYLPMTNQYPINVLLERSRVIGYELFAEEHPDASGQRIVTIHYRPTGTDRKTAYSLVWGKSLISFQPTLQTANLASAVTVRGWDRTGKTAIQETFTRAQLKGVVGPADLDVQESALAQKEEIVCDFPISTKEEAKKVAEGRMLRLAQGLVEARARTVGLPRIRAGVKVAILGVGARFSGNYLVTSSTHTIGEGGYTTDFTARMESKSTTQKS